MNFQLSRIIIFTTDVAQLAAFYEASFGLKVVGREEGWIELAAGGCNIAFHQGKPVLGNRPPKLVFYAADVASARAALTKRGVSGLSPVKSATSFDMCDGRDPDGNRFQISSR